MAIPIPIPRTLINSEPVELLRSTITRLGDAVQRYQTLEEDFTFNTRYRFFVDDSPLEKVINSDGTKRAISIWYGASKIPNILSGLEQFDINSLDSNRFSIDEKDIDSFNNLKNLFMGNSQITYSTVTDIVRDIALSYGEKDSYEYKLAHMIAFILTLPLPKAIRYLSILLKEHLNKGNDNLNKFISLITEIKLSLIDNIRLRMVNEG